MGKGTISLNRLPQKRKLYGDNEFYLRPIFMSNNEYYFAIRPSQDKDYVFEIEGEFGTGERSLKETKKECKRGDYKNTKYVFYKFEYESMTDKQKKLISKWTNNLSI
jgi:hypothetical protein